MSQISENSGKAPAAPSTKATTPPLALKIMSNTKAAAAATTPQASAGIALRNNGYDESMALLLSHESADSAVVVSTDSLSTQQEQELQPQPQPQPLHNAAEKAHCTTAAAAAAAGEMQRVGAASEVAADAEYFANKNNLAKLNWWNSNVIAGPPPTSAQTSILIDRNAISISSTPKKPPSLRLAKANYDVNSTDSAMTPTFGGVCCSASAGSCSSYLATPKFQQFFHHHNYNHHHHHHHHHHNNHHPQQRRQQSQEDADDYDDEEDLKQEQLNIENTDHVSQDSQLLVEDQRPCVGLLNANEEDEMKVTGYRRSTLRTILCWLCIVLTGGLLRLILHWWQHWFLFATHQMCPLDEAEKVLIQEDYQGKHKIFYVKKIQDLSVASLKSDIHEEIIKPDTQEKKKQPSNNGDINTAIQIQDDLDDRILHLSVHFSSAQFKHFQCVRIFNCKQLRYAWDNQSYAFYKLKGLDVNVSCAYFHQQKGLAPQEQNSRRIVYGPNEITVPYKDIKTLLFLEALNPFYVFQIFSVLLWFTYDYYYYACVILLMSIFGITMSIIQTKKNQDALRETVSNTGCALVVSEKGEVRELPTQCLVPGDIIEIPTNGCTMQCDAVLLSGNCILDESMLTGESVPVTKAPLPMKRDLIYDNKEHARHTLFCGTKVIQTRYIGTEKVLAIVTNTGNITAKGGLIRSILYPPPVDYKFEQDSYKFIECLGLIALIGFVYTLATKILRGVDPVKIAVESLDLITIVVPPALPAAMTVGRFYAQKRLERNNIYCISPRSINVAGSIDCCCFDKTGTLTEDGLDMWGVVPKSATNQFQIPIKEIGRLPCDNFLFGMVTCHSITIMNGKKMGDPLDLKMFESTGWILEDPKDIPDSQKYGLIHPTIVREPKARKSNAATPPNEEELPVQRQSSVDDLLADVGLLHGESKNDHGIVREFPFTSTLQRMSVITRRLSEKHFNVYCKGSPEMLQQLCHPSSLPENYTQQLAKFAKQGYRIIALAYKPLSRKMNYTKAQRLMRESVESDLEFLGFVILENRLKPDTTEVIQSLTLANIRTIMVTGDNILTALSVARDCGIVSETQAVVTVNVRQRDDIIADVEEDENLPKPPINNYELYYTLEMGSKECMAQPVKLMNGNGHAMRIKDESLDYGSIQAIINNGIVRSVDSSLNMLNSSSLASVQTCDTWTHNDCELTIDTPTSIPADAAWRHNYRFAMVGRTWQIVREHFPSELRSFITRGAIFARMSPEQKQSLIMELQNLDYCVAMCGDGANDCGALKVAHTGISLSESESSIASPFTSCNPTIACVPKVIKEGRAALVTSFGIFKYMAAYSMVQFISVMMLYSIDSNLTDKQYLYIDLGLISIFAFFFGKTEAYAGPLVKQVPLSSLISLTPLASIVLHLMVVIAFQVAGWYQVHEQDWFTPFKLSDENHLGCYENYTMFAISSFQYIILAFAFSKGAPYRKAIWSNIPFCLTILINLCIVLYLIIYPVPWLADFFQLIMPPVMDFRYIMLVYGVCIFATHIFVETFIIEYLLFKKYQVRREQNPLTSKRKYMQVEYDLQYFNNWPKITEPGEMHEKTTAKTQDNMPLQSYVEISAEQNVEPPAPKNNPLYSLFEIEASSPVADAAATPSATDFKYPTGTATALNP